VSQAPLIALYNKYKDSKGKQAKLKSPGQLQELLDVVRALLADMEAKSSSQRYSHRHSYSSAEVAVWLRKA
jgi:inositol hexakisphosphate/diphosphoinositol-pentakisphosphate kinase